MKRLLISCALALPIVTLTAGPAAAEVKTREKSQVKIEGMIGRMMTMFGGKAAKEGVVATAAVKGNRKATMNDSIGQNDRPLRGEIYDLNMKKKTYQVTTFDELRRQMKEAKEKAEKEAREQSKEDTKESQPQKAEKPEKEYEVDFDVKETGQKKQLAGYDAREVVMTVTLREKGKQLEDSGGFVMTADSWLGPQIAALKELHEFDARYWKQLQGEEALGMSPEQVATRHRGVSDGQAGVRTPVEGGLETRGHSAGDDDDVRVGQVEGADGAAGREQQLERRWRPQRHAGQEDGEEG